MAASSKKRSSAPAEQAPDLSITADDHVHLHAAGYNESPERGLIHSFARFRSSPLDFIREVSLHVSGTEWRSYDNIVGQPVYYSGFSELMKSRVLSNPMLVGMVRELAAKRVEVEAREGVLGHVGLDAAGEKDRKTKRRVQIEEHLMEVSETLTDNMICKMESKSFIRGAYYLATQLLTRAYHQGRPFSPLGEDRSASATSLGHGHGAQVDSGLMSFQAFTSRARRSFAFGPLQRKRRRTSNLSSFSHAIDHTWIMCVIMSPRPFTRLTGIIGQSPDHLLQARSRTSHRCRRRQPQLSCRRKFSPACGSYVDTAKLRQRPTLLDSRPVLHRHAVSKWLQHGVLCGRRP